MNLEPTTAYNPSRESAIKRPLGLSIPAHLFSVLFHPLFVPLYVIGYLAFLHPDAFTGFSFAEKRQTLLIIGLNMVFFPLLTVLLLKALGFLSSLRMESQKDRIIPYIATGIFYFWGYLVFKQQPSYTLLLPSFILGAFLAASGALIMNIYVKVSMHAIGLGGWLGFLLILAFTGNLYITWVLAITILITGLTCTVRLLLGAHRPFDIYAGLLLGILAQSIAFLYVYK